MPWLLLTLVCIGAVTFVIAMWSVIFYLARKNLDHGKMLWDDNGDPVV